MIARSSHGVIALASADLRPEPDHRAELTSQLLLGEVVRLLGPQRKDWHRVENTADGYRGWVKGWALVPATAERAGRWRELARTRVEAPLTRVRVEPSAGGGVGPLFFGSRVIAGRARGGHRPVELPDGRRGWLPSGDLRDAARPANDLLARVRSLLGEPYLWGGRTAAGYDCSGFVQQVLAEQGVPLPRDAHEQFLACRKLTKGEQPLEGDLVFFRAAGRRMEHVGIGLGGGYYAHARGAVRVSSLKSGNELCDNELITQFIAWSRPLVRVPLSALAGRGPRKSP